MKKTIKRKIKKLILKAIVCIAFWAILSYGICYAFLNCITVYN